MKELLTKKQMKCVKSLDTSKGRKTENAFKAEGTKCVTDTIGHFPLKALYATEEWVSAHDAFESQVVIVRRADLIEMSSLVNAPDVLAIYEIPDYNFDPSTAHSELIVALDTIQDPGNLGTIMRVADWFGIRTILASRETADCFSPKVVQATMGSISRVRVIYGDLPEMIQAVNSPYIYGTFLDGESLSSAHLTSEGIIIIGNEGKGISKPVSDIVTRRLHIPSYPDGADTGESLNAAVAAAITIAKFRGI